MDPNVSAPGAAVDGSFRSGNPYSNPRQAGTALAAKFLNSLRREINAILAAAGLTPSEFDDQQILTAIRALYVLGLPPDQAALLRSNGPAVFDPDFGGGWQRMPGMPYVGAWSTGNSAGTPPPSPFYEEATGEYYNTVGVQANTGGVGVRTQDARTADDGIWCPQDWVTPDSILAIDVFGRLRQSDAVNPRNFYMCIDPNGDCANKQNSWGSNDAVVLRTTIAANAYPTLTGFHWRTLIVNTHTNEQLYLSKLSIASSSVISGKRIASVTADERSWSLPLFGGSGWNFTAPVNGTGHLDYAGNTMLGLRFASSGTQDAVARMIIHTIDAQVARHRWG